jgi:hypothetical protein
LCLAALELPLGQYHCRAGDLLRPQDRVCVVDWTRRRLQCPACLLEGAFGVFRVFARLEPAQLALKLGGLRS